MKKYFALAALACAAAFGTTSCQKDQDTTAQPRIETAEGASTDATTDVVPSVAAMNSLFNDIVNNSCRTTNGRAGCIPFQYATDGCYARAHAMRRILLGKGYTTRKVFSYNTIGETPGGGVSTLSVRKLDGTSVCVRWWYHVAPLVKVRNGSKIEEYVFDPSMFNRPVYIKTWLDGQRNGCGAGSTVTLHRTVDSRNYAPANGSTTSFTTDDNYTHTNQTLAAYRNSRD